MTGKILMATIILALAGCGGDDEKKDPIPLESKKAALTATENIENHLKGLETVLKFIEASALLEETLDWFDGGGMVCSGETYEPGEEPSESDCYEEEAEDFELEFDKLAEGINEWLMESVFVDSQIETDDGTTVVYLLNAEVFCGDDMEGEFEEEDGPDCTKLMTDVPVRISVVSYNEGNLDIDILFGAESLAPLHIALYGDLVSGELDLAVTREVALLYVAAMGEEEALMEIPSVFEGKLMVELTKESEQKYSLTYSVLETIKAGMTMDGDEFSMELGKSSMTATADAAAKTISWDVDFGQLDVTVPYQEFIDAWYDLGGDEAGEGELPEYKEPPVPADDITDEDDEVPQVTGELSARLAGFNGSATFSADADNVSITGLGLGSGASFLKKGAATLFSLVMNEDDGWSLDLTIGLDGSEIALEISPLFDLSMLWNLAAIQADLDEVPEFMLDETFTVLLDSAPSPAVLFTDGTDDVDAGMKVTAGKLTMSSSAAPDETLVVEEGQCLVGGGDGDQPTTGGEDDDSPDSYPDEEPEGHGLLGMFELGEC